MGSGAAAGLETTCRREGGDWILNGRKKWIGNATFADFTIVWARDVADQQVKGFLVDRVTPGFQATKIHDKMALRTVQNAEITLSDCRVPESKRLEKANSFKDTRGGAARHCPCRRGLASGGLCARRLRAHGAVHPGTSAVRAPHRLVSDGPRSVGPHAEPAHGDAEHGLPHLQPTSGSGRAPRRTRFAGQGLLHQRLSRGGEPGARRASRGKWDPALSYDVARFVADAEALYSYEGTKQVNSLIVGRAVTGFSAFV